MSRIKVKRLDGTPVTIGAFAFVDYDDREILSRKFFSDLELPPDMTDAEILKSFDTSTIDETEKTVTILSKILQSLKAYLKRIKDHAAKLENLAKKFAVKFAENNDEKFKTLFARTRTRMNFYNDVAHQIVHLGGDVQEQIEGCKNTIRQYHEKTFATRLKKARNEKGYTQQQLAEKLGIARITLTQYERAVNEPNFSMLVRIAKLLNVSLDWLSGLSEKSFA